MKKCFNILLALMELDIGGAETHVVELAKGLKKKGFNVIMASNGGVYLKEVEDYGIKHYKVPLHNKQPSNMIKSYGLLKQIIEKEQIDLVHAHARIPAFLCGLIHKKMKFPFVTTAHGIFSTSWGLKYMTDWGQKTLAVSEDIKKHLMDVYHLEEERIKVTINGIDTERFSPHIDVRRIQKEFDFQENKTRILHVSRLNEDTSEAALQLIELSTELVKHIPNLEIVIVGDGKSYEMLRDKAEKVNAGSGDRLVVLAGGRTDVNQFIALSDLFVGISRAALEAMAAEKPVLLAGNKGYIGVFEENKLKVAIQSNFTCRGEKKLEPEQLKKDILEVLKNRNEEQRKVLGKLGKNVVEGTYSVEKMVQDNMEVYEQLLSSKQ